MLTRVTHVLRDHNTAAISAAPAEPHGFAAGCLILACELLGFVFAACRLLPDVGQTASTAQLNLFARLCSSSVLGAVAACARTLSATVWPLFTPGPGSTAPGPSRPAPGSPAAVATEAAVGASCYLLSQACNLVSMLSYRTPGIHEPALFEPPSSLECTTLFRQLEGSGALSALCAAYLEAPPVTLLTLAGQMHDDAIAVSSALEALEMCMLALNLEALEDSDEVCVIAKRLSKDPKVVELVRAAAHKSVELEVIVAGGGSGKGSGREGGISGSAGGGTGASIAAYRGGGWPLMHPDFRRLYCHAKGLQATWTSSSSFFELLADTFSNKRRLGLRLPPAEATALVLRLARARAQRGGEEEAEDAGEDGAAAGSVQGRPLSRRRQDIASMARDWRMQFGLHGRAKDLPGLSELLDCSMAEALEAEAQGKELGGSAACAGAPPSDLAAGTEAQTASVGPAAEGVALPPPLFALAPAALEAQATMTAVLLSEARVKAPNAAHEARSKHLMEGRGHAEQGPGDYAQEVALKPLSRAALLMCGRLAPFVLAAAVEGAEGDTWSSEASAAVDAAAEEAGRRLAGAGFLRTLDSLFRHALSASGAAQQTDTSRNVTEATSRLLEGGSDVVAYALLCSLSGPSPLPAGSVGPLPGAACPGLPPPLPPLPWSPARDLGVWVTCAKLMRRAVWEAEREAGAGVGAFTASLVFAALRNGMGRHGLSATLRACLRLPGSPLLAPVSSAPADAPAALAEVVALVACFGLPCAALCLEEAAMALGATAEQPSAATAAKEEGWAEAVELAEAVAAAVQEAAAVLPASELLAAQPLRALWAVAAVLEAAAAATPEEQAAVQAADRCPRLSESLATAAAAVCAAVAEAAQADATLEPAARALLHPSPSGVGGLGAGGVASWHPDAAAALARLEASGETAGPEAEDGASSVAGALAAAAHAVGAVLSGPERWEELQRDRRELAAALAASVLQPPGRRLYPPSALRLCGHAGCSNWDGEHEARLRLRRCGGCGVERYCGPECQRAAWCEGHSAVCRARAATRQSA